jgi:hypothetical protein
MIGVQQVPGPRPPLTTAAAADLVLVAKAGAAILVEGWSDQAALETLARRRGRDLHADGVVVLPIGGVTNVDKFVQALGPPGLKLALAGLCDAGELVFVSRGLQRVQAGSGRLTPAELETLGFFVCDPDLEDELIRAVGNAGVERILAAEGELESFRRFQAQPAQRGRDHHAQLHRFMGTRAGRKIRYGSLLVEALDLDKVPRALDRVLVHVHTCRFAPGRPLT